MDIEEDTPVLENRCTCGSILSKQKFSRMEYRNRMEPGTHFTGNIVAGIYFECSTCAKKVMSPEQFCGDFFESVLAGQYEFALKGGQEIYIKRGLKM